MSPGCNQGDNLCQIKIDQLNLISQRNVLSVWQVLIRNLFPEFRGSNDHKAPCVSGLVLYLLWEWQCAVLLYILVASLRETVVQITYFCSKHIIFWVPKCVKCVHTEKYMKMNYLHTQNSAKIKRGTTLHNLNEHHIVVVASKLLNFWTGCGG